LRRARRAMRCEVVALVWILRSGFL
jgi:hypothetical protein